MRRLPKAPLMAIWLALMSAACATTPAVGPAPASADSDVRVEVGIFYDALAPYGDWWWDDDFGWVWSPAGVAPGWRPYTDGWWVYTDVGWCWQSDLAWGWAPFHYGRWVFRPARGWLWLPGSVWAPAWVAWRCDEQWIGWAPLPPEVGWRGGLGLQTDGFDLDVDIAPSWWSFCAPRDLVARDLHRRIVPVTRNASLVRQTRNVTRLVDAGRGAVERGLDVTRVQSARRQTIKRYRVADVQKPSGKLQRPRGELLHVYRPQPDLAASRDRAALRRAPDQPPGHGRGRRRSPPGGKS